MLDDFRQLLRASGTALLRKANDEEWMLFTAPFCVLQTDKLQDALPMLAEVERLTQRQGLYAVGFIAYEAARAFDPAFRTQPPGALPLAWFAVYRHFTPLASLPQPTSAEPFATTDWRPDISAEEYRAALARIREYIAAGDTYQVNYTFRLRGQLREDAASFFARLCALQPTPFSAFINTGAHIICSASPELFFDLAGQEIMCRPMKGTRSRGRHIAEDRLLGEQLREARKDRAENLMIVDMLRNDLGRIATPGSVRVRSLFDIERHPTVWQMTSTICAETRAPLVEILRALFPCASITGAPKIRATQIIAELEKNPRGVYTGTIGFIAPDRRARFSVAIRTACIDEQGNAQYGVGAGILWDSAADTEYAECLAKARILQETPAHFELLETLLWEPPHGFRFEDLHVQRLADSAEYFGYPCPRAAITEALGKIAAEAEAEPQRVRLRLARDGSVRTERSPAKEAFCEMPEQSTVTFRVVLARSPISSADPFFYHKTTNRAVYEAARRVAGSAANDVILWNERGEVTESTMANLVAVFGGEWITPPISCGLLAGVYRQHLLQTGRIRERMIKVRDLAHADALYLINSVRGWISCVWAE